MPVPSLNNLPPKPTFSEIESKINELVAELTNTLLNLDSLNVVSLTADHVDAGTLNAGKVTVKLNINNGGYITIDSNGITVNNGTKNTFRVDLNGNVTAEDGTITGGIIRTSATNPRIEMTGNRIKILYDADTWIEFNPEYLTGFPVINFHDGTRDFYVGYFPSVGAFAIDGVNGGPIQINSNSDIQLNADGLLKVPDWLYVANKVTNQTLQAALDSKAVKGASTSTIGDHNHGITTGRYIMTYDSAGNQLGLQLWSASGSHSHTQN
ncbi:hypothetical protein [Paenibacillus alkalitolerans]|uniref:hypothetical protein n=1 Tax=Paenibacillus alkalitolerans TaxID=2799335 RepID=UPI0018F48DC2|nr:hypothetical protein [Paenibacillus alkalitolerans]